MQRYLTAFWILFLLVFLVAATWYAVREYSSGTDSTRTKRLARSIALITAAGAVLAGIGQGIVAATKFQEDYASSVRAQRQATLTKAAEFTKEPNEQTRAFLILGLSDAVREGDDVSRTLISMLVRFIRSKRSIDLHHDLLRKEVTEDVQAAISVIGMRPAPRGNDEARELNFRRLALMNADFSNGQFDEAAFDESELRLSSFSKAHLEKSRFVSANFDYWCVPWARHFGPEVDPNNLFNVAGLDWYRYTVQASFRAAHVEGATFKNANLIGVDFGDADLSAAEFESANISFAQMSEGKFSADRMKSACTLKSVLPESLMSVVPRCDYRPQPCGKEEIWLQLEDSSAAEPDRYF